MLRDVVWTFRWLRRRPLFTLTITTILALGIGANTAIFSIVDAVLLRPLPYTAANRLVRIRAASTKNPTIGISAQELFPWRARTDLFEKTVPFVKDVATITGAGDPDQVWVCRTGGDMFAMLGARARLGRTLVESDDGVAVLSYRLWQRRFQGDPSVVGTRIALSDQTFTIVGVMPPDFDFPRPEVDLWVPLRLTASATTRVELVARLARDKTAQQAQSAMEPIAEQMRRTDRSVEERRIANRGRAVERRAGGKVRADAGAGACRGGIGPADRLRGCFQPARQPRGAAAKRDRDSHRTGRRTLAGRAAALRRKLRDCLDRQRRRSRRGRLRSAISHRTHRCASDCIAAHRKSLARRPCFRFQRRGAVADRMPVYHRAAVDGPARRSRCSEPDRDQAASDRASFPC